jgi:hypothetical protein
MFSTTMRNKHAGLLMAATLSMGGVCAQAHDNSPQERKSPAHRLSGDYGLVTQVSCAYSDPRSPGVASIDPTTGTFLVGGQPINLSGMGIMTFSPDGKLTLNASGAQFATTDILAGHAPFLDGFDSNCSGNYTITAGSQLSLSFTCAITAPSLAVKLVVGPVKWDGFIGPHREVIHLNGEQNVQTITISLVSSGAVVQEEQRICMQTSSLDKL